MDVAQKNAEKHTLGTNTTYDAINLIKLQDFKRKVYLIGVFDDPLSHMVPVDSSAFSGAQKESLNLFQKSFKEGSDEQ